MTIFRNQTVPGRETSTPVNVYGRAADVEAQLQHGGDNLKLGLFSLKFAKLFLSILFLQNVNLRRFLFLVL